MKARYLMPLIATLVAGCGVNSSEKKPQVYSIAKPAQQSTPVPSVEKPALMSLPATEINIPESAVKKPEKLQSDRRNFIISLIREGIFDHIEMPATLPRVWVGPPFMNLDFKTKSKFIEIVYAYYFDRPDRNQIEKFGDTVILIDLYTGKRIGTYNPWSNARSLQLQ